MSNEKMQMKEESFKDVFSQFLQGSVGMIFLYTLLINFLNETVTLILALTDKSFELTKTEAAANSPVLPPLVTVNITEPYTVCILSTIIIGVITYYVLKWLCSFEWVKKRIDIKSCWKEVKWYNPFSWFKALVCTFVHIFIWILQKICKWAWVLVTSLVFATVVICFITISII